MNLTHYDSLPDVTHLTTIFKNHFDAMFFLNDDEERTIIDCNQSALDLFEFEKQELIDKSIRIIHTDNSAFNKFQNILSSKSEENLFLHLNNFKAIKKDGSVFPTEHSVIPIMNDSGARCGWISIVRDISTLKAAEIELRNEKIKFHNYLDIVGFLVLVIDHKGNINLANKRACDVLEYKEKDLIGKDFFSLVFDPITAVKLKKDFTEKLNNNEEISLSPTKHLKTKRGKTKIIEWRPRIIVDIEGTASGTIISGKDVTSHILAQEKAIRANKELKQLHTRLQNAREKEKKYVATQFLDEIGQTLTGFSFEISELEKMIGNDAAIIQKSIVSAKLKDMGNKTKAIIKATRELSSEIRPTILDDLDFPDVLEWFVVNFQYRTGIICNISEIDRSILLNDETLNTLFRLCQEIFNNIKEHSKAENVNLSLTKDIKSLKLEILDDGIGIPVKKITSTNSLGILSIREYVKSLFGKVSIRNEKGNGTRILVTIPLDI